MQVSIKLVGILQDYYPEAAAEAANGDGPAQREIEGGTTVRAFLDELGVPDEAEYFIMINDTLVEPQAAPARELADGDEVVLAPIIKGG